MKHFDARIIAIQQETPLIKSFILELLQPPYSFKAGQWAEITCDLQGEQLAAAFSITSTPENKNTIQVAVKRSEHIPVTRYLHDEAKPGDLVTISDAMGNVFIDHIPQQAQIFVAGGVGVTPLISMITYLVSTKTQQKISLLYSITNEEEYLFSKELEQLQKKNPTFNLYVTTTQAPSRFPFNRRIDQNMLADIDISTQSDCYLCGPPEMVDNVAHQLEAFGIKKESIFYDKWW